MVNIEPVPIEILLEWITNVYAVQGTILILQDHEDNVVLNVFNLSQQEIQDALASSIYINRAMDYYDEVEDEDE